MVIVVKAGQDCRAWNDCTPLAAAVRRLDGVTGAITWEHLADVEYGTVSEVAIRPDGMVFFTDKNGRYTETSLIGMEGVSGVVHRWPIAGGRLLLASGANVNARTLVTGTGPTALYWAIANGPNEIVQQLS